MDAHSCGKVIRKSESSDRSWRLRGVWMFKLCMMMCAVGYLIIRDPDLYITRVQPNIRSSLPLSTVTKPTIIQKPGNNEEPDNGVTATDSNSTMNIMNVKYIKPDLNFVTHPEASNYRMITPTERITKGSYIHVVIEARSESKQLMPHGGDFWFATMSTNAPHQASTAGRIIDHNNGTYSVYFYAAWSGNATITIILVHPSKAVEFIDDKLWNTGPKVFWSATFLNMTSFSELKRTNKFDTLCWITSSHDTNISKLCEYPSPNGLGSYTFVCQPPMDGRCRSLDMIAVNAAKTGEITTRAAAGYQEYFQRKYFNQRLTSGPQTMLVKETKSLPASSIVYPLSSPYVSHGYWYNFTWTSFLYKNHKWTREMKECLRNKHFMLLGDSTSRQWADNIGVFLGLSQKAHRVEFPGVFFEDDYKQLNLSVSFRFHPQIIVEQRVPFNLFHYFADILDSIHIEECANLIIELSPWAHLPQWTRDSLWQRFIKLKEAVMRLRLKCPNVPVIIKGPHYREHRQAYSMWGWSDYMLYQIGIVMENIFNESGAWFLNVWDMNLSFPSKANVHMPKTVVQEELKLAISHVCDVLRH